MKEEIAAAVFFLVRLAKRHGRLGNDLRDRFAAALTSALFENYKNHWYPETPSKGQAYRCLRMNRVQLKDPLLQQVCVKSTVCYEDLGLPQELTVWVDPGEVSCRYGERSASFCVSLLEGCNGDREFSRRIHNAVERAATDIQSGASSDEEDGDISMCSSSSSRSAPCPATAPAPTPTPVHVPAPASATGPVSNLEPKTIPTISNPNSVYQFSEFAAPPTPQTWAPPYPKRKAFPGDGYAPHGPPGGGGQFPQHSSQFSSQKGFRPYRPYFSFTGPRVDKYHWVSKTRS